MYDRLTSDNHLHFNSSGDMLPPSLGYSELRLLAIASNEVVEWFSIIRRVRAQGRSKSTTT
jgi:hypothetical protein